jgi:hypothetical protein
VEPNQLVQSRIKPTKKGLWSKTVCTEEATCSRLILESQSCASHGGVVLMWDSSFHLSLLISLVFPIRWSANVVSGFTRNQFYIVCFYFVLKRIRRGDLKLFKSAQPSFLSRNLTHIFWGEAHFLLLSWQILKAYFSGTIHLYCEVIILLGLKKHWDGTKRGDVYWVNIKILSLCVLLVPFLNLWNSFLLK